MEILVYGASGAQGTDVVLALVAAGHTVKALVRSEEKKSYVEALGAFAVVVDFANETQLTAETPGMKAVFIYVPATLTPAKMETFAQRTLRATQFAGSPHTLLSISSICAPSPLV
jgi:uncharacterized protein YbjT (DUF2867 family)